ncbi:MAG TPA: heat-inducible transcriptional repressor HrcA [Dehalococcoidia bacterium]|nr:heat-inducible transcriptional repressor HrcA [Dehalococcoidia bacterium]
MVTERSARLSGRQAEILRYIVDMYVGSAHPVASQALARGFPMPLSPATIRNEMMRLEEAGYITQPHTSSGRVPSEKGYRYYVEALMPDEEPDEEIKRLVRHQFHQAARDLEEWFHLAATILAANLRNMAVVTSARVERARLRWLELQRMHEGVALLVLGLDPARVRQQILIFDGVLLQEELAALAQQLGQKLAGLAAQDVESLIESAPPRERQVLRSVADLLAAEDKIGLEAAAREGLREVLRQPEFEDSQKIINLLEAVDERNLPRLIPSQGLPKETVTVIIGQEHPEDIMHDFSLIITSYGDRSGLRGSIAVVGPTRLRYASAIPMVRYVASVMNELLARHFG